MFNPRMTQRFTQVLLAIAIVCADLLALGGLAPRVLAAPAQQQVTPEVTSPLLQQPPTTYNAAFALGGQVDALDDATLAALKASGMTWVQYRVDWTPESNIDAYVEKIGRAQLAGLRVMVTLVSTPQYATSTYYAKYAAFAGQLAKAGVNAIEVWRDMNLSSSWMPGEVSPLNYTILLQITHVAVKAANPNTMLVSGAPRPLVENARCDGEQCDDLPFIKEMARYGAFQFADCMGVQYQDGLVSPLEVRGDPRKTVDYYTRYFQGMMEIYSQVNGGEAPLCFTNLGYLAPTSTAELPPSYSWAEQHPLDQTTQAQFLMEAALLSASQSRVSLLFVNNLSTRRPAILQQTPTETVAVESTPTEIPVERLGSPLAQTTAVPEILTIEQLAARETSLKQSFSIVAEDGVCTACQALGKAMSLVHPEGLSTYNESTYSTTWVQEADARKRADEEARIAAERAQQELAALQTRQAQEVLATQQAVYILQTQQAMPTSTPLPLPTDVPAAQPTAVPAQPQPTAVPPQPTAVPVNPGNYNGFELGGQVQHFAQNAVDAMNRSGMKWVKHQVVWGPGARPEDSTWLIGNGHSRGFKVLLSVKGNPGDTDSGKYPEYARFVAVMASAGADAIEVWNEPNLAREWTDGHISPTAYTDLLRQAYQAIKGANGNTMVISAAPAPTGFFSSCTGNGCNDYEYIQGMVSAGALNYMDCLGAHYNEGLVSPYATSGDPRGSSEHYTRYYQGIVNTYWKLTGGLRPICFTELGFLTGEEWGRLPDGFTWRGLPNGGGINMTVATHAQYLAEAAQLSATQGKVRLMVVWNVDFTRFDDDPMAGFAIIRPNGSCPACDTLGNVMRGR